MENKNNLESMVFQAEKLLRENADKVQESTIANVQKAIDSAKKCLTQESTPELIKSELDTLTAAVQGASKEMYESAAKSGTPPQPNNEEKPSPQDDDVIDADFKEV